MSSSSAVDSPDTTDHMAPGRQEPSTPEPQTPLAARSSFAWSRIGAAGEARRGSGGAGLQEAQPASAQQQQQLLQQRVEGGEEQWVEVELQAKRQPVASASGKDSGGGAGGCTPPAEDAECRICLASDAPANLVSPCKCTGSVRYAHLSCLLRWCRERASTRCEICGATYRPEVLPQLEAEVKAAQQAQQRLEDLVRQNLRQAEAAVAAGQPPRGSPERGAGGRTANWVLLKVIIVLGLTGGLLYGIFFLGSQDGGSMWAAVLLRILIFLIPVYLVYRGVSACLAYRAQAAARPPDPLVEQREERRPSSLAVV